MSFCIYAGIFHVSAVHKHLVSCVSQNTESSRFIMNVLDGVSEIVSRGLLYLESRVNVLIMELIRSIFSSGLSA
jgi:hypothetical protein